jgi:hypothetical protein
MSETEDVSLFFDEERTLYSVGYLPTMVSLLQGSLMDIRAANNSRSMPGIIRFEGAGIRRVSRGSRRRFMHMKEKSIQPDNYKSIQRYGYHPKVEWESDLLYILEKTGSGCYRWKDSAEKCLGVEADTGLTLEVDAENFGALTQQQRDALLMCWVTRLWADGCVKP